MTNQVNPAVDALKDTWTDFVNDLFTHHPLLASATLLITWRDDASQPGQRAFIEHAPDVKSTMVAHMSVLFNLLRTAEALVKSLQMQHLQLVEMDNELARGLAAKQAEYTELCKRIGAGAPGGAPTPGVDESSATS